MYKNFFMQDNFLNKKECNDIIDFYKSQPLPKIFDGTYPFPLTKNSKLYIKKYQKLLNKINKVSISLNKSIVDWFQIVKWPAFHPGKKLHFDKVNSSTILSSILYLNSDFEGGHTYFTDGTSIAPKAGRIVFFDGKYHYHGVSPIYNNRYTIAAWYKKQ